MPSPLEVPVSNKTKQNLPWSDSDQEYVKELVYATYDLLREADVALEPDRELIKKLQDLLQGIHIIKDLFKAFHGCPDRTVADVGNAMELTRNGVYFLLHKVGLDPDDFRKARPRLRSLIARSNLSDLVETVWALSPQKR